MTEAKNSQSMVLPVVAAAAAGAGIALLFAPQSGRQTREQLKTRAHEMQDKAKHGYDQAKQRTGETTKQAKEMKDRVAEAIKTTPKAKRNNNTQDNWEEV